MMESITTYEDYLIQLRMDCAQKKFDEMKNDIIEDYRINPEIIKFNKKTDLNRFNDTNFVETICEDFNLAQQKPISPVKPKYSPNAIKDIIYLSIFTMYLTEIEKELEKNNISFKNQKNEKLYVLNEKFKNLLSCVNSLDIGKDEDLKILSRLVDVHNGLENVGIDTSSNEYGLNTLLKLIRKAEENYISDNINKNLTGDLLKENFYQTIEDFDENRNKIIIVLEKYMEQNIKKIDRLFIEKNEIVKLNKEITQELELNRLKHINHDISSISAIFQQGALKQGAGRYHILSKYGKFWEKWKPVNEQIYNENELIKHIIRKNTTPTYATVAVQIKTHQVLALLGGLTDMEFSSKLKFLFEEYQEKRSVDFFKNLRLIEKVNKDSLVTLEVQCIVLKEYIEQTNEFLTKGVNTIILMIKNPNTQSFKKNISEMDQVEINLNLFERERQLLLMLNKDKEQDKVNKAVRTKKKI